MNKKRIFFSIFAICIVVCIFAACSKEQDRNNPNNSTTKQLIEELDRNQIDLISEEVSLFHDVVINKFLEYVDNNNHELSDDYLTFLYDIINEQWNNYPFEIMNNNTPCSEYLNFETFCDITDVIVHKESFSSILLSKYNDNFPVNYELVDDFMNYANQSLYESLEEKESFDEFYNSYYTKIAERINESESNYDYFCMKLYSDMLISSFQTWCNYLYSEETDNQFDKAKPNPKDNRSWWQKVKDTAKDVWKEVKPVVASDAAGAVAGAAAGAVAGGVGAGPGAAVGAIGCSAGKCADEIINRL